MYKRILKSLIIINLVLITIIFLNKITFTKKLLNFILKDFLVPILISIFFAYIIKPINKVFKSKGFTNGKAAVLSLIFFIFIITGIFSWLGKYIVEQFNGIITEFINIIGNQNSVDEILKEIGQYTNLNVKEIYVYIVDIIKNHMYKIGQGVILGVTYILDIFSKLLLIVITIFYILKDGDKFNEKVVNIFPIRYKKVIKNIFDQSDEVLSCYVTGQAKVAVSLAIMIFIGYKTIKMPNALFFSFITFILAFIPFMGFFISMIIPVVIAISIGWIILLRLIAVFMIVQTLKGRIVVPAIMGYTMDIHPITDIFLVIGAVALGGPVAAFVVVPIYSIVKVIIKNINISS
ncbi:AI-2E family transporter [Clostridium rectalis]|uniref:AI-2E family transporter n=1 Tax=Clostridium rectalis TaxID=2040295 RepID=UPI000F6302D1|nr:AI-2E family transporter [Clostridium rectalis]